MGGNDALAFSTMGLKKNLLLTEYLAVRISMEWAFIKPYLPLLPQKVENQVPLEPLIAYWVHWGNMPMNAWWQLSSTEIKSRLTLAYRFDQILRNRLWLEAWEKTYEDRLKQMITSKLHNEVVKHKACIGTVCFLY